MEGNLTSVTSNGDITITVSSNESILTTKDGFKWNKIDIENDQYLTSVTWNGKQLVALSLNGDIIVSTEGMDLRSIPTSQ